VPISNGGSTQAAIDSAKLDERIALVQKEQFNNGIRAEVEQAIIAVKDALERSKSTEQTVVQAREAYRLATVRFKAGVDTQLSVNDSQTALVQAEVNQVNAQYDYLAALARLLYATGEKQ
jgi:outer membrane protein TolC